GGRLPGAEAGRVVHAQGGVDAPTRIAAMELGPNGVRVNSVAPGFVETPMTQRNWTNPDGTVDEGKRSELLGLRAAQSPLHTTGDASDIALAILYAASDAAKFMTGQVLRPNGGAYMA